MEQLEELAELMELLETKQYTKLRQYLAELNDADIAVFLEELEEGEMLKVFRILPVAAKKMGFDPAVMASPFITTIVDALSLIVYFQAASWILGI